MEIEKCLKLIRIFCAIVIICSVVTLTLTLMRPPKPEPQKQLLYTYEVQQLLRKAGYNIKVDGIIGKETLDAWMDWQNRDSEKRANEYSLREIESGSKIR
jgi:hypothetical protein